MNEKESELSCFLQSQSYIYNFSIKLLYRSILSYSTVKSKKEIVSIIERQYDSNDTNIIIKQGFTTKESKRIVNKALSCIGIYDFISYIREKKYTFHEIMGAFYGFTNLRYHLDYVEHRVEHSKQLQSFFTKQIKTIFNLPSSVDWKMIKDKKWMKNNEQLYYEILSIGIECPESIYRRGMKDFPFVRKKTNEKILYRAKHSEDCHSSLTKGGSYTTKGSSFYKVDENTFYHKIMSHYDQQIQAGPSGSSIATFLFVFTLMGMKKTKKNMMLLLLCIIADYVPHFHSLTEILVTYSFEIGLKYKINKDPVETVKKWMNIYL